MLLISLSLWLGICLCQPLISLLETWNELGSPIDDYHMTLKGMATRKKILEIFYSVIRWSDGSVLPGNSDCFCLVPVEVWQGNLPQIYLQTYYLLIHVGIDPYIIECYYGS